MEDITVNPNVSNIEHRLREIETEGESERKEITVMHSLVNKFNSNLTEIEQNSKQSIQEVQEDVQSIRENICEMLNEVPQITMSSLETRFCNIEERLSTTVETSESKNSFSGSLIDVHSATNESSRYSTAMRVDAESTKSHEEFMIEVANEVDDRQKRKKTLVVHNVEENNDAEDYLQVTNILNEIIGNNLVKQQEMRIYRLGKRTPGKNRSIKVHLKLEEVCRNVLQQAIKLRKSMQLWFNKILHQFRDTT